MDEQKTIRVLIADDSQDDVDLLLMQLRRGGYAPDFECVETAEEMTRMLQSKSWDLILCDYSMPEFDGLSALKIVNDLNLDIPFILISGAIGEELAVRAMKSGAHDYLMKDNLQRLIPAIERELKEAKVRRLHRESEKERNKLWNVVQKSLNEIYIFSTDSFRFNYINSAALANLHYRESEVSDLNFPNINPDLTQKELKRLTDPLLQRKREKVILNTRHQRRDGSTYPVEIHLQLIEQDDEPFFAAIGFDQTDRQKDARRIKQQKQIAEEHAQSSKYKSEFLANMSHELRTPLNSIILLSQLLRENKAGNLTDEQKEYIQVIHHSGSGLLELINEVLDLSKIEAGEMEFTLENVSLKEVCQRMKGIFKPISTEKGLEFIIKKRKQLNDRMTSDRVRIEQILKNLLSNAFKFTEKGTVELFVYDPEPAELHKHNLRLDNPVAYRVKDTGIGIPKEKQNVIFESFRQVDGTIQRQYGGTGLGLTICKELTRILGGDITLHSEPGEGCVFTVYLPADSSPHLSESDKKIHVTKTSAAPEKSAPVLPFSPSADPHTESPTGRKPALLICEFESETAEELKTLAREAGIPRIPCTSPNLLLEQTLQQSVSGAVLHPATAGMSGWSLLKQLRNHPATANLPVCMIADQISHPHQTLFEKNDLYLNGLLPDNNSLPDFVNSIKSKSPVFDGRILLIDDNKMHNDALKELVLNHFGECLTAESAATAFDLLQETVPDCIALDMTLPDAGGDEVLQKLKRDSRLKHIPVIIYTGKSLKKTDERTLLKHAEAVVYKSAGSFQQLISGMKQAVIKHSSTEFSSRDSRPTILIAEDDDPSFFSISSVLKTHQFEILRAENGQEALDQLQGVPGIDLVMMDIMMPVMNGLDAIRSIRSEPEWENLPIFAVTAKAMAGDREKCISGGASEYISKPIDSEHLLKLLRIWL